MSVEIRNENKDVLRIVSVNADTVTVTDIWDCTYDMFHYPQEDDREGFAVYRPHNVRRDTRDRVYIPMSMLGGFNPPSPSPHPPVKKRERTKKNEHGITDLQSKLLTAISEDDAFRSKGMVYSDYLIQNLLDVGISAPQAGAAITTMVEAGYITSSKKKEKGVKFGEIRVTEKGTQMLEKMGVLTDE